MRPALAALALLLLAGTAAALSPEERALIVRSVRVGELKTVEAATGGLDALPLVALEITVDLEERRIQGHARLDWRNTTGQPLTRVPLRLSANGEGQRAPHVRLSQVMVTLHGKPPRLAQVEKDSTTVSTVFLPEPLLPGERVAFDGPLEGELSQIAAGGTDPMTASFMAILNGGAPKADGEQYGTFACGDGICTMTGFAPEVPAFLDGAFDLDEGSGIGDSTFSEPANVLLSVIADSDVKLAATGLEVGRIPAGKHRSRTTFAMAAAREVGVVASRRFVATEAVVDGVRVRSLSRASDRRAGAQVLEAAKGALATFDKAFGRYPWSHLDVAESALVGGAGGVELPGLALGASGFYRPADAMFGMGGMDTGDLFSEILDFVTRHEVAHQWWHAQVGSHAQRHPYVDEPLAQWSALLSVKRARGANAALRVRDLQVAVNYQALGMMGLGDGKVARPAGAFRSQIEYAGLVYGKAPLFYEAAAKEMGEAALIGALRSVVAQKRFRRVSPEELKTALVAAAGAKGGSIAQLWTRWFEESHGDEDVGQLDMARLLGTFGGAGATGSGKGQNPFGDQDFVTPQDAMKLLQQFMQEVESE